MCMEQISTVTPAGAADSKLPKCPPQAHLGNFRPKNGTGSAGLQVPPGFGSSRRNTPRTPANFGSRAGGCYKATVNESETINEAKPLCLVRGRGEAGGPEAARFGFSVGPLIERS
jgi:hypothetical protein